MDKLVKSFGEPYEISESLDDFRYEPKFRYEPNHVFSDEEAPGSFVYNLVSLPTEIF